jgi:hypothetical protein
MKRNALWIVAMLVVGFGCWRLGRASAEVDGFEFTVEVTDAGVHLVATDGCEWGSASYRGEGPRSFAFIVDEAGVRSATLTP